MSGANYLRMSRIIHNFAKNIFSINNEKTYKWLSGHGSNHDSF